MKKIITSVAALLLMGAVSFAQDAPKKAAPAKKAKTAKAAPAKKATTAKKAPAKASKAKAAPAMKK